MIFVALYAKTLFMKTGTKMSMKVRQPRIFPSPYLSVPKLFRRQTSLLISSKFSIPIYDSKENPLRHVAQTSYS